MTKKTRVLSFILFLFLLQSLFAQEIPYDKSGLRYDFRIHLLEAPEHNFDILHYQFEWKINFDASHILGKAVITSRSLIDGLNQIILHLANEMAITGITQSMIPLTYSRRDDLLEIDLIQSINSGEEFSVEINYNGNPQAGLNFSYHQGEPIIWSLDEPIDARHWFPCYDLPNDKATAEMRVTVPGDMQVASNGTLSQVITNSDNTVTYNWKESYQIATYLISVAATNYETYSDFYYSGSKAMEVRYFVYPEHLNQAQQDFSNTVFMIDFFSSVFGEYPFIEEKYGMAVIPPGPAMEHQTCTSYAANLITGNHSYDWIVAHELAHQWWGDLVTPASWADIWLNEGFATYSDALWHEHIYGSDGLKSRMANFKERYYGHIGAEHPIYNPPEGHLFCRIEYDKAAWVLHMLRFVVGDDSFFKILKKYAQDYAYSTASTEDFETVCEQVYGSDLGWFFNQWIYQSGYPTYSFGWGYSEEDKVRVVINQTQTAFPLFKMPVEIKFVLPSGSVKKRFWVEKKNNTFEFFLEGKPSDVSFDPDSWVLCEAERVKKSGRGKR